MSSPPSTARDFSTEGLRGPRPPGSAGIVSRMYTRSAARSLPNPTRFGADVVSSRAELRTDGLSDAAIDAQLRGRRWQQLGRAIIKHNAPPTRRELERAALITLGPRALLTSFTALDIKGLQGWGSDRIHVLLPRGARVRRPSGLPLRIHYTDSWPGSRYTAVDDLAHAAVLAASSMVKPRPACGLLAAVVQQRLCRPTELTRAVIESPRTRHRRTLLAAMHDIEQGAQALSEIDFARLCRRHDLPGPERQAVRTEPSGKRRYLDVEWLRPADGRRVVAEVDGALHLAAERWWNDQLRQNELAIADDLVLRFPSTVLRCEEPLVVDQLRRALRVRSPAA